VIPAAVETPISLFRVSRAVTQSNDGASSVEFALSDDTIQLQDLVGSEPSLGSNSGALSTREIPFPAFERSSIVRLESLRWTRSVDSTLVVTDPSESRYKPNASPLQTGSDADRNLNNSGSSKVGLITGIVIGIVALLIALILFAVLRRRCNSKPASGDAEMAASSVPVSGFLEVFDGPNIFLSQYQDQDPLWKEDAMESPIGIFDDGSHEARD
jgi:hypothetical protein